MCDPPPGRICWRGITGDKSGVIDYTLAPTCRGDNAPKFALQRERPADAGAEGATAPETLRQMNRAIT